MRGMAIVFKKDLRATLRSKSLYIIPLVLCLFFLQVAFLLKEDIMKIIAKGLTPEAIGTLIQSQLDKISYTFSLVILITYCMTVFQNVVINEKLKRTIEALLCTPLNSKGILLGKSLVIVTLSYIADIAIIFILLTILNFFSIAPSIGFLILPSIVAFLTILVMNPLMTLFLTFLVSSIQFIVTDSRTGYAIFSTIIFVQFGAFYTGIDISSWNFFFINFIMATILAMVAVFIIRYVTPERIVLTCKG